MTVPIPDWQQQAQAYYLQANYSDAASLYEQAIATTPDVRAYYWHLGLLYLLQGQEEDAQMTWLSAIAEGTPEQIEVWLLELIELLSAKAQEQELAGDYHTALLIRQHIRENVPTDLNNLISIIGAYLELSIPIDDGILRQATQLLNDLSQEVSPRQITHVLERILTVHPTAYPYEFLQSLIKRYQIPTGREPLLEQLDQVLKQIEKSRNCPIIILDNTFPHLLSAFRIAEYNTYLENFKNAVVYSTNGAFGQLGETRSFAEVVTEYELYYPHLRGRTFQLSLELDFHCKLFYTIFLKSALAGIYLADQYNVPLVFTLYPGMDFLINEEITDTKLHRIFSSPMFQKVIVTQKFTYDYLLQRKFCDPKKIEFIYGGVFPSQQLERNIVAKRFYKKDKQTFDICFVAHKYMEKGLDKGYDIFIEVAKLIATRSDMENIYFHVVGSFDETDIDVSDLGDNIKFYGTRITNFFPEFYAYMDIILSPNAPFILHPGAFDGFPTGCCIEAGLCGVAVFCTDILNQNIVFSHREEIVIIPRDSEQIHEVICEYYKNLSALYELAHRGQSAFKKIFDITAQMQPRLKILTETLV